MEVSAYVSLYDPQLLIIHSKSGFRWFPETADNFNFPQKHCLRKQRLSILLYAFSCFFMHLKYFYAFLCILRSSVAKLFLSRFCRFFETEKKNPQTVSLLECMGDHRILDTLIFRAKFGKIEKKSEKYFLGKFFRKLRKNTKNIRKNTLKNSEK